MAANVLALPGGGPSSAANSPRKGGGDKKRKRKQAEAKDKEYDSDAELEVSAEDLVAADADGEEVDADADGEGDGPRSRARVRGGDGEDEDEEEAAPAAAAGVDVKREAKRRRDETLLLRGQLDEEQGRRFDAFQTVVIPRGVVKRLNRDVYDQHVPNNLTAVLAGMVKVFVADVVETAKALQPYSQHPDGPLQPYHLQLARVRLQEQGLLGTPRGGGGSAHSSTGLRSRKRIFRR
ncbi:Transcription initiation factor TFIID subunit 11 [Vanrija pseudolonga]|uniref:Transcription initiation factor TFIID subunit 11 n=1 Tax=Vanrija pseudolonga TaxID=143232 RepID=A0AAF0Y1T2_9TREE|nr:Transcription initiation factor TFIID subunit 11 [Vanrija pseudolonga]